MSEGTPFYASSQATAEDVRSSALLTRTLAYPVALERGVRYVLVQGETDTVIVPAPPERQADLGVRPPDAQQQGLGLTAGRRR